MAIWKDKNGKTWNCEITIKTLKDIKNILGVDFLGDVTEGVKKLRLDLFFLCNALYVVHKDECDAQGISDEDFGKLLVGDTIDDATKAFINALICFFPKQQREMLEQITNKREAVEAEIMQAVKTKIAEMPTNQILQAIQKEFGVSFTN